MAGTKRKREAASYHGMTTRKKTKAMEAVPGLLRLPPELRNRIYEYVLVETEAIQVTTDLLSPGLLHASHQIRQETLAMYYGYTSESSSNEFVVTVNGCDATVLNAWTALCSELGFEGAWISIQQEGYLRWRYLERWCKTIWEGEWTRMVVQDEGLGEVEATTAMAHEISQSYKIQERTWTQCLAALKQLKEERS